MNASSIRRFLQAPDQLRFPIAAPAVLGALWLCIAMGFGFAFGVASQGDSGTIGFAYRSISQARFQADAQPAYAALDAADNLDRVVRQWNRLQEERQDSFWAGLAGRIPAVAARREMARKNVANIAESRLKYYSGDSPLWKPTASLCIERVVVWKGNQPPFDFVAPLLKLATDYSLLLGREVKPADLAPLVPGGKCE